MRNAGDQSTVMCRKSPSLTDVHKSEVDISWALETNDALRELVKR